MMNILAIFAHPDDETMLCGGTLALLAGAGMAVQYVCATRGEGGETGEPAVCTREEIAQIRSQELACAVDALGGASLQFLEYVDPLIGPNDDLFAFKADATILAQQVVDIVAQKQVEAILTHGSNGEYGHPGHLLLHNAVVKAARKLEDEAVSLYTVQAQFDDHPKPRIANKDDRAHLVLDISPVLAQKTQAALCHRTQHALFVRRTSKRLGYPVSVPDIIMKCESLHRQLPAYSGGNDRLFKILEKTGTVIG